MHVEIKRIYDNKEASPDIRILIDRLWPRGISKNDAHLDYWFKQWAPSNQLRIDFHKNNISWEEFSEIYKEELKDKKEQILRDLEKLDKRKSLILLYGSKNRNQNHAILLRDYLLGKL